MKKILALAAICLLVLSCSDSDKKRSQILKVYNWADYIEESVLEEFPQWYKEQTGEDIEVIYQTFDINEVMLTKISLGHEDFDVVCPSDYMIQRMARNGLLIPLDRNYGSTPDYTVNCSHYLTEQMDNLPMPQGKMTDYAVPYMWGTAGILYNTEYVTEEEALTWDSLWDEKFKGKLLMKDAILDVYFTATIKAHSAQLAAGEVTLEELYTDFAPETVDTVEAVLKRLKPNIAGWEADFGKEMMTKGSLWMNFTWSGDAVWAIEEAAEVGVDLEYTVPMEGSSVWFDGWVIPKYARNIKAANYFINYMCQSDVAIRNMDEIGYVSSIATAEVLESIDDPESEEFVDLTYFFPDTADADSVGTTQYPSRSVVERCALMCDFGDKEMMERVVNMWSRVKGDNLNTGMVIFIFSVFGVLFIFLVVDKVKKIKRRKKRPRRR